MQQQSDAIAFLVVLCLPFAVWVVSRPPVWNRLRRRLEPAAVRLWQQLIVHEEPDEQTLRRWAVRRLEQLRVDLERVRRLVADDDWMTATRQVGNRLAYERLVHDTHEAEFAVLAFGPIESIELPSVPALVQVATSRFTLAAPAVRSSVEVIEFGPASRWR